MIKEENIQELDIATKKQTQNHLDNLIKPVGSFASLEKMVVQAAGAQEKVIPDYLKKVMICVSQQEPSKSLKALSEFTQAELIHIYPLKNQWSKQIEQLMEKFISEKINMIGIALPDWAEEEIMTIWSQVKNQEFSGFQCDRGQQIDFLVDLYQKAAAHKMLLMLDGPASWLVGILAKELNPGVIEYFVSSRDGETCEKQAMLAEIGLEKGMRIGMIGDGGLSSALGFTLVDAAVRTIHDIATFAQAQVEYAYNAPTDKRM
jgi:NaMN:DMB phosphoribosyltransferase